MRLESDLTDVVVDGVPQDHYYWTREVIVITTQTDVYLVKTFRSSPDHRNLPADAYLTGWFIDFRVLAN